MPMMLPKPQAFRRLRDRFLGSSPDLDLTHMSPVRIILFSCVADSSRGPGYRPLKAETRVRIPYPLPDPTAPGTWFPGRFFLFGPYTRA